MKRFLLKIAGTIGAIIGAALLIVGALLIWVAGTESGLQFVWQRVAPHLPEEIDIEALEGRLSGPLVLTGVGLRTETLQLRIERAELQWHPLGLLAESLDIERLYVRGLDVVQLPSGGQPPKPAGTQQERIELPLDIQVARASLEEARFRSAPEAEPLLIERVDLQGRFDRDESLQGQLDWVLRSGNYPNVIGSTRLSGSLRALTIQQRIEAPYNASAEVLVREPLGELSLDGELTLTVQPAELGIDLSNSTIDSSLSFEGTLERLALNGRVALSAEQFDRVDAQLQAAYEEGALQIENLQLAHSASTAAMQASGRVAFAPELALDLRSTWTGLQWPLRDQPQASSESGSLEVRGTLDGYVLSLDANVAMADGEQGHVRVAGTGDAEALFFDRIEIDALQERVVGRGELAWRPQLGGAVELSGRLRDRPIEVSARGEYSVDTLRLETLALQAGATRIDASGTAARDVAMQWRIDSPDLGDLWPSFSGKLAANGKLSGPRMQPHVTVDAHGQGLTLMGSEVGELTLTADIDVAGRAPSQLDLSLRDAEVQGNEISELELSGAGNAARHELKLTTTGEIGAAQIALVGGVERPWQRDFAWSFEIDTATLAYADFPPWQLREPSRGGVSAAHAQLAQTCWQSGAANLCVEGVRRKDRTEAAFSLSELPFDYFAAAAAEPVQIEGEASVEGTFEQRSGGLPQLNVLLTSSLGRIVSADSGAAEPYALGFGPIEGSVRIEGDRIAGELSLPFEHQGQLELEARVGAGTGAAFAERSLEGSLSVQIEELDFVSKVVSALQDTQGTLGGDLRLSGTIGEPRVTGELALDGGRATVREANVVLEDLGLTIASDGGGEITVEAQGTSGGGSLEAHGRFALAESGPEGRITVRGQAFEVVDSEDAHVLVSPDLDLELEPDRFALTGSVTVPEARLTPRGDEPSVIAASADQVIVDADAEGDRALTRPLYANVRLTLGDEVHVEGYGLTGRLGGGIEITEVPREPITGSGELRVEKGVYEAYGQKLEVEQGQLLFAGGPIDQPGLAVEAVRRPAEGILVGARVRGTLKTPELTVFSEPTMPQQEQLSYLVLGRPLQSASASESSAMSRAALALGLRGGNFVSERVNKNLGLDEFGIQSDPNESAAEASFVIGKYLSPSLYVSYGIGLFEPVNTLKLKYTISERWRLVTESSSEASGGDVIYNIERK